MSPRGIAGSGTRTRSRRTTSASSNGTTSGSTATLERAASTAAVASRQIKPVFEFGSQRYAFGVIQDTYQAIMQHGSGWIPVASIPGAIVSDWLMMQGVLPPLGFMATNGMSTSQGPGRATRAARNSSQTESNAVSTGNRV